MFVSIQGMDWLLVTLFIGHPKGFLEPAVFAGENVPIQSRDLFRK